MKCNTDRLQKNKLATMMCRLLNLELTFILTQATCRECFVVSLKLFYGFFHIPWILCTFCRIRVERFISSYFPYTNFWVVDSHMKLLVLKGWESLHNFWQGSYFVLLTCVQIQGKPCRNWWSNLKGNWKWNGGEKSKTVAKTPWCSHWQCQKEAV